MKLASLSILLQALSALLEEGAEGPGLVIWAAVGPSVSPSGSALHPGLPLASMKSWGPSPSLGNLPGTQYPHSCWTSPFCLPSTALSRGWRIAPGSESTGGSPFICPASLMLFVFLSTP